MKKNFLALWMALCLLVTALPAGALAETDVVQAECVDAEVMELDGDEVSAELADLGELAEPVDADVPAEVDGLELSDLSDDAACCAGDATGADNADTTEGGATVDAAPVDVSDDADGLTVEYSEAPVPASDDNIIVVDDDDDPAEDADAHPTQDSDADPTQDADADPAQDADADPAQDADADPTQDADADPAQDADADPAQDADADPAQGADADSAQDADADPTQDADDKTDGETVEKTDENTEDKTEENSEEKSDEEAEEKADGKEDADGKEEKEEKEDAEGKEESEEKEDGEGKEDSVENKVTESKADVNAEADGDAQTAVAAEDQSNSMMEPASALTLDQTSVTIPVQGTVTLKASGGTGTVTWTSENAAAATVDAQGVVTAVGVGSARIVAKEGNGAQAACDVTVIEVPPDVAFEAGALSIGLRETRRLPRLIWEGGAKEYKGNVSYSSADAKKVTVTADGQVRGVARGSAQITATFPDGKTLQCAVTVKKAPSKVTVKPKRRYMGAGESVQLSYTLPAGSASAVTWSSSNPAVVAVNAETGVATAQGVGKAKITARTYNGKRAKVKITVYAVPTPVVTAAPGKVVRIGKGDRVRLQTAAGDADPVTGCTSRNRKVVRSEGGGVIYGLKTGSAKVTVRTAGGSMRVKVVVRRAPRWISASPNPLNLGVGETYTLKVKTSAGSAGSVLFTGDAPSVFSVNQATGQITGIAPGTGTVKLVSFNGKETTCPVTVHAAPTTVAFDPAQTGVGKKQKLQLQMQFDAGAWSNITYEVENPKIAKVSADGVITGLSIGQTVLRARTYVPGLVAETVFTVWGPPSRVWLDQKGMTVEVGQVFKIEPRIPAGSQTSFTFKSSRKSVATVAADGTVTPLKEGTTKITVTTHNKKKTTLKLTVKKATSPDPGKQNGDLSMTIPARTTALEGIAGNLAIINAIKTSTFSEINRLKSAGTLTAESAARRKEIVENIFANYAFTWMTPSLQKYWKAANSENGAKDFKPNVVYYGMPYISGSGANRRYNAALAVAEERYTDSGQGYYMLNKNKYLNGKYVGNDCSGLVNVSIWGTNSSHSADRTEDIFKNSAYTTINDFGAMLPGDLVCKSNAHVVMFLYYTNAEKTSFMMIENGGSEKGTNTVHCDIKTVSGYKKSGYRVRRLAGL